MRGMTARIRESAAYEEILDGELYTSPPRIAPQLRFASAIMMDIGDAYDRGRGGPGGWWIMGNPEIHLLADVVVGDVAGWRRERMPKIPASFNIPPDWICEVLSPSTSRIDRAKKMPIYARHEVAYAWLVDPVVQTAEVMKLIDGKWRLEATFSGSDMMRAEPFEAIEIDLASIWGPPPPNPS